MSDSHMSIRLATPADASALDGVLRSLGWFERLDTIPQDQTSARIRAQIAALATKQNTLLVAVAPDGVVVGYVMVHWFPNLLVGGEGYISELFLRPEARGQGVGTTLLDAVKNEGRARGCERLMLFNRKERESYQRRFYHNRGWVERDDAALLMLDLEEE